MDICLKNGDNVVYLENNGIVFLLGPNQCGKTYFLKMLQQGFEGKQEDFKVNNTCVGKSDYSTILLDDITDFANEFKFTKNNLFRELIYSSVLNIINEDKLLKDVNDVFDRIDRKVNRYLDLNVNKNRKENLKFDIEINKVDDIIDKFTNIYIDDYLLKEDKIPRSVKRKLIFNLLFLELDNKEDVNNIILIDNFDLYLDIENTLDIIKLLQNYHKNHLNTYFFLTTNSNIYPYINNKESVYHINSGNLLRIKNINELVEASYIEAIMMEKNNKMVSDLDVAFLYQDNIVKEQENVLSNLQNEIGKIYVSREIEIVNNNLPKLDKLCIVCKSTFEYVFFKKLYDILHQNV